MNVFIDNNIWDKLYEREINPIVDLGGTKFILKITPDLRREAEAIKDKTKRDWVLSIVSSIETCAFFEFSDMNQPNANSAGLGFGEGTLADTRQSKYINEKMKKKKGKIRPTGIPTDRTDIHLSAFSQDSNNLIITNDTDDFKSDSSNIIFWNHLENELAIAKNNLSKALRNCLCNNKNKAKIDPTYTSIFSGETD